MGLRVPPTKNPYCKKARLDFGTESWQKIWISDMVCTQQNNIGANKTEKLTKYRQLAFEIRERRPGYEIYVVPVAVGALGGGIKALKVSSI